MVVKYNYVRFFKLLEKACLMVYCATMYKAVNDKLRVFAFLTNSLLDHYFVNDEQ